MPASRLEVGSLVVAGISVFVSLGVAFYQSSQTRDALFESRVQSRISSCVSLGALYASQSWAYDPIVESQYERYGISTETTYDPDGPNLLLASFSHKSIATGRALQLCLVEPGDIGSLKECIATTVDGIDAHKVDDSEPSDGVLDNIIC